MFANRAGVSTLFAQYHDPEQAFTFFFGRFNAIPSELQRAEREISRSGQLQRGIPSAVNL